MIALLRRARLRAWRTIGGGSRLSGFGETHHSVHLSMTKLHLLATPSLAVSLALALAACGRSGDSRPDLLLVSARDGDYAIYVLNADGSAQTRLTENAAGRLSNGVFFQVEPDWSPDGQRIVFASRRHGSFDIYVMNADGTGHAD